MKKILILLISSLLIISCAQLNTHPHSDADTEVIMAMGEHIQNLVKHMNAGENELAGQAGEKAINMAKTVSTIKEKSLNSYYAYTKMAYQKAGNFDKVKFLDQDRISFFNKKNGLPEVVEESRSRVKTYADEYEEIRYLESKANQQNTSFFNIEAKRKFADFYLKYGRYEKALIYQQPVFDFMNESFLIGENANNGFSRAVTALGAIGAMSKKSKNVQTDLFKIGFLKHKLNRAGELEEDYKQAYYRACDVMATSSEKDGVSNDIKYFFCEQVLNYYANLFAANNMHEQAKAAHLRVLEMHHKNAVYRLMNFSLDEKSDREFLTRSRVYGSTALQHLVTSGVYSPAEKQKVYEYLANMKGKLLDIESDFKEEARKSNDPEIQSLYKKYKSESDNFNESLLSAKSIDKEKYTELMLGRANANLNLKRYMLASGQDFYDFIKLDKVLEQISDQVLYIDILKLDRFNYKDQTVDGMNYYAVVVDSTGIKDITLLAKAEDIDPLISEHHEKIRSAISRNQEPDGEALKGISEQLYQKSLIKFESEIQKFSKLIINADGGFQIYPLEILRNNSRYLIEDHEINYVSSIRDLMDDSKKVLQVDLVNIFANPLFDSQQVETNSSQLVRAIIQSQKSNKFSPLPDTKREASLIQEHLKNSANIKLYEGDDASEISFLSALVSGSQNSILHIASHGFFLPFKDNVEYFSVKGGSKEVSADYLKNEDPLSRSGIALSGANYGIENENDEGLITGRKLINLDMSKVGLIVLSACNTGSGDIQAGEGVFGLQRALMIAGAKNLIVSEWAVPSLYTTELMNSFYENLRQEGNVSKSLRAAQLELMKKTDNPFNWGAFIHIGQSDSTLKLSIPQT